MFDDEVSLKFLETCEGILVLVCTRVVIHCKENMARRNRRHDAGFTLARIRG